MGIKSVYIHTHTYKLSMQAQSLRGQRKHVLKWSIYSNMWWWLNVLCFWSNANWIPTLQLDFFFFFFFLCGWNSVRLNRNNFKVKLSSQMSSYLTFEKIWPKEFDCKLCMYMKYLILKHRNTITTCYISIPQRVSSAAVVALIIKRYFMNWNKKKRKKSSDPVPSPIPRLKFLEA